MLNSVPRVDLRPRPERVLSEYAERLARSRRDRVGFWLHLSRLRPRNRRPYHMRVAASMFEPTLRKFSGQLFQLSNCDTVLIVHESTADEIEEVINRVRQLFQGDPLTAGSYKGQNDSFSTRYRLAELYPQFLNMCEASLEVAELQFDSEADEIVPLDPERLAEIEDTLAQQEFSSLLRHEYICAIKPGAQVNPMFTEVYLSLTDFQTRLVSDVDLAHDRWLFRYLTEILDSKLLDLLLRDGTIPMKGAISVGLNVNVLLSETFDEFHALFRSRTQQTVMFQLQKVDVYADVKRYIAACEVAKQRGYAICIDGLNNLSFTFVNRENLRADLLRVHWNSNMDNEVRRGGVDAFRAAVKAAHPERVILSGCSAKRAIEFGWSVGITIFQGSYVDNLLSKNKMLTLSRARD
ncbi:MAG: hypothetical protein V3V17_03550 [Alphaproteobacteria bacterium]